MFPIQATVTLQSAAQLNAFNEFITGGSATVEPESVKPTVKKEAEAKKPASSSGTTSDSAASAAPSDTGASSGKPAIEYQIGDNVFGSKEEMDAHLREKNGGGTEAPALTIDQAKDLTMKIVAAKGRDAAVELLKKYGVPVAAKLAADQVNAFCADADAVLAS